MFVVCGKISLKGSVDDDSALYFVVFKKSGTIPYYRIKILCRCLLQDNVNCCFKYISIQDAF